MSQSKEGEVVYRKVSVKDRFPEKEGCFFVDVIGVEDNSETGPNTEYTIGAYHRFVNTFQGKYFSSLPKNERVTHWLEPIPASKLIEDSMPSEEPINAYIKSRVNMVKDDVKGFLETELFEMAHFFKHYNP